MMTFYQNDVLCASILFAFSSLAASTHLPEGNVIGHFNLTNQEQCLRLCWYTAHCATYSFQTDPALSATPRRHGCILHKDTGGANLTPIAAAGWVKKRASSAGISNGCSSRPCNNAETCVPAHALSTSGSAYTCLPELQPRTTCNTPEAEVANGTIIVLGDHVGDEARLKCNEGYAVSPKDAGIVCLATSQWTALVGRCVPYEIVLDGTPDDKINETLPWNLENSEICIKGIFNHSASFSVKASNASLLQKLRLRFRIKSVFWSTVVNRTTQLEARLGKNHLNEGDNFNLTVSMLSDKLQFVLNEVHDYSIALDPQGNRTDYSQSKYIYIRGTSRITYINLIYNCTFIKD